MKAWKIVIFVCITLGTLFALISLPFAPSPIPACIFLGGIAAAVVDGFLFWAFEKWIGEI